MHKRFTDMFSNPVLKECVTQVDITVATADITEVMSINDPGQFPEVSVSFPSATHSLAVKHKDIILKFKKAHQKFSVE